MRMNVGWNLTGISFSQAEGRTPRIKLSCGAPNYEHFGRLDISTRHRIALVRGPFSSVYKKSFNLEVSDTNQKTTLLRISDSHGFILSFA
jgi:hypothetical protein